MDNILNGDIFDRSIHTLYVAMAFFGALVALLLLIFNRNSHKTVKDKFILTFFGFAFFYCFQDGIWGIFASTINKPVGLMIASAIFHLSSAIAPVIWTIMFLYFTKRHLIEKKIIISVPIILFIVQATMIIINFFNKFMFYVDDFGNYQTTDSRAILFYLQFIIYLTVMTIAIIDVIQAKSKSTRSNAFSFLWISIAPVFFDFVQLIYPDAPANSIGICLSCILIQTFLARSVEEEMRYYKENAELQEAREKEILSANIITTLSFEYGPIYLMNLATDDLQVYRTSTMERALPVQELAFEMPKFTPFIREYAARHVVEIDRDSFITWTNPSNLNSIINTDNITEFNYQRNMNGTINYYQFCCARVPGNSNKDLMVFGFRNVDTMVRKDLETKKTLEQALIAANAASKAKTEFLFNMSHDIRTPMNAILGFTDIAIKHGDDSNRVNECLLKIKSAGEHLLNLINDILEMSRIESGALEITNNPANIETIITGIATMSQALALSKSIDFKLELNKINNPHIYVDELHFNEVIINLISNAIKYTPNGGKVKLIAKQKSDVSDGNAIYHFEVIDNGIGMSEEFQVHLFEAFSREKTSTVSKQQGAGLGLSIVKRIVDLAGGTISVKSKVGEGSSFALDIPMQVMTNEEIDAYNNNNNNSRDTAISNARFTFEEKKVLLVDDNELNREIAKEILTDAGLIVETAEDGEFAVQMVKEKGVDFYDFILMDIQMPVMDGFTATKTIRELPNGNKAIIIALSANAFEEDIQKSLSSGMNAHVAKPINVKLLFETMQSLVD